MHKIENPSNKKKIKTEKASSKPYFRKNHANHQIL